MVRYLEGKNQGNSFHIFRVESMNVPEDYDDKVERSNTHPELLAEEKHISLISEVLRQIT